LVLLTHGHWDHIASLGFVLEQTGAKVAVHHNDQAWVETGTPPFPPGANSYGRGMIWLAERIIHPKLPPVKVDIVLGDDGMSLAEYGIPGKVVHTPGHTQGSVMVLLESGEAFVGDMAMNAWFLRRTPGLPILAEDLDMVVESWKKVLPMGIKCVYPAHGRDFPADIIQKEILTFEAKQ
jgi:hydroxyacylglutathione hydrolase